MIKNDFSRHNAPARLEPVRPEERIPALDAVRGFALMGVLLAYALWNLGNPPLESYSTTDKILNFVLALLIDTKAYTIFATLFGLGFAIQMQRAEARGGNFAKTYRRRLLILLGIGLAHALLLRNGDILAPYALMGFILLLFRHAPNRTLLLGSVAAFLFQFLAKGVWEWSGFPIPVRPNAEGIGYFAENLAWVEYWYSIALWNITPTLTMFLFGHYLGRRFYGKSALDRRTLRRISIGGLLAGILIFLSLPFFWMIPEFPGQAAAGRVLWTLHGWSLAAFYASTLILLLRKPAWQRRLAPLGAVGRMALTNYLLQAALIVPVCLAFDLFGKVTPATGLLLALGVALVQIPFSLWWLKRFEFGPVEWVWRKLTYGGVGRSEETGTRITIPIVR